MADIFSYLDVSSSYSNGALTITVRTKDGFTSAVVNLALNKLGSCSDIASAKTGDATAQSSGTDNDQNNATEQYVEPGPTPGPGPNPTKHGFGCAIKFRATYGDATAETNEIDTTCSMDSTLADNKTYTLTIHTAPTGDTFTLEILGLSVACTTPVSETSGQT